MERDVREQNQRWQEEWNRHWGEQQRELKEKIRREILTRRGKGGSQVV